MTLVVARIIENDIHILSDSKITDPKGRKTDHLRYAFLKTIILHPYVCLSFAGITSFAEEALSNFFNQKIEDLRILLNMLLEIHNKSGGKTLFGIASIIGKSPQLFEISNGVIKADIHNFWLADHQGFSRYQEEFLKLPDSISIKNKMQIAHQKVIEDANFPRIGNFQISVSLDYEIEASKEPVFLYDLKTNIEVTASQSISRKAGEWEPLSLGKVENGDYGISYLTTVNPDYNGVALHFPHGKLGVLFCPRLNFERLQNKIKTNRDYFEQLLTGEIINNVSGREFIEKIKNDYNIPLRGFVKDSDTRLYYIDARSL